MMDSRTEQFLPTVASAVDMVLRKWGPHIAFEQVRVAPERLFVHFLGHALQGLLDAENSGAYTVRFEKCGRTDLSIHRLNESKAECLVEVKVPWSGWTSESAYTDVAADFDKLSQCETPGIVVALFIEVKNAPEWSPRKGDRLSAQAWKTRFVEQHGKAEPREGVEIHVTIEGAQISCTPFVWAVAPSEIEVEW